jgi:hypothetical protein
MRTLTALNWRGPLILGLLCALVALLAGALLSVGGPVIAAAAVAALGVTVWFLRDFYFGFWAVVGIVLLLPFAAFPLKIVFTPTFLDAALGGLLALWVLRAASGQDRRPKTEDRGRITLPGPSSVLRSLSLAVAAFAALACFAFVFGLAHAPLTAMTLRHFAEMLMSLALFFVVVDSVRQHVTLERLVRAVILAGALAAALGIALYALPDETANQALNVLRPLGYPTGDVIRYIEDNPTQSERAIGTSVDPNVFGGVLSMTAALALPQLTASRRLLPRRWTILAVALLAACLVLTFSRGAFLGLAAAALLLAVVRYRRLLPLLLAATLLLLLLPSAQAYVARFAMGVQGQDLATQMRFGEYKDALTLIGRYPVFGVGFSSAPDLDLYLGVSNVYLLIAEEMGLVGLVAFLGLMAMLFALAWRVRREALADARLEPLWLGLHAALAAALVGGLFDHYFFNLDFHHAITFFWLMFALTAAASGLTLLRERAMLNERVEIVV